MKSVQYMNDYASMQFRIPIIIGKLSVNYSYMEHIRFSIQGVTDGLLLAHTPQSYSCLLAGIYKLIFPSFAPHFCLKIILRRMSTTSIGVIYPFLKYIVSKCVIESLY